MSELRRGVLVQKAEKLRPSDLEALCDAAEEAIRHGGGFGWLVPPPREVMERYWRGVLLVPERTLFVARLDGMICGSAQLVRPPRNNEAQAHTAQLTTSFVAPWARGHGIARALTVAVETAAREAGFKVLNLDVRETQTAALALYERLGFIRFGTHPHYALVEGRYVTGHFYYKDLTATEPPESHPSGQIP
ncbi:GNAT family N-acetyltransferase [Arenibaculum pallidiluteum]|uniref:GNAT family N-acetyltransferase n=1 Tax=Arenibaculum pallidiluteum TaxID=2812559 RepID=UPI001A977BB3|nr:GNAT family N-acetyltransferase [Arenibaculum pallidiluteum]